MTKNSYRNRLLDNNESGDQKPRQSLFDSFMIYLPCLILSGVLVLFGWIAYDWYTRHEKSPAKKSVPQKVAVKRSYRVTIFDCIPGDTRACGNEGIKKCLPRKDHKEVGYWGHCVMLAEAQRKQGFCLHGYTRSCGEKYKGLCSLGFQQCLEIKGKYIIGKWSKDCPGYIGPQPEVCDGYDNDCDGVLDNNLKNCDTKAKVAAIKKQEALAFANMCRGGFQRLCGSGVGECSHGTQTCGGYGTWDSECVGAILPMREVCNGLDDDCDGQTDEDLKCPKKKKGVKK